MSVLVITGTGTGVGKTAVTAAVAALAIDDGKSVAVLKPAQTGVGADEPGDVQEIRRLTGPVHGRELARYPDPLSPEAAARRAGLPAVHPAQVASTARELAAEYDLVLVEGAGGLLVRFGADGSTLADVAWSLSAPVLLVAGAELGTLNVTALTAEVAERRGLDCIGVVIGRWPDRPGLAERCNVDDLPVAAGAPLLGALPDGLWQAGAGDFTAVARQSLSPVLGGLFDPEYFDFSDCTNR